MGVKTDDEQDVIDNQTEVDEDVVEDPADEDQPADDEDQPTDGEGEGAGEGEGDEIVVSIGDESEPAEDDEKRAPEWVRELRKSNREKDRRIRELEQKVQTSAPAQAVVVGDEPTLESCDYDAEQFARELKAWVGRKADAEQQQRARSDAEQKQNAQWQGRMDAVHKAVSTLKVKDYEEAAEAFDDVFSIVQRGIVIGGPDDPKTSALLRYALGKNPKKAKELAAIKDLVKFSFAVAKLETQLKITPRKSAPPPDRQVRSAVAGAAAVDNQLARLQAEADKTGDRSKVASYIRTKNKAKQAA